MYQILEYLQMVQIQSILLIRKSPHHNLLLLYTGDYPKD